MPHSRRPRAILIGDDILAKVGGYVLGNLVISVIAGVLTFIWLMAFGVPYALLLSILVACSTWSRSSDRPSPGSSWPWSP